MESVTIRLKNGPVIVIWPDVQWVVVARPLGQPIAMELDAFVKTVEKEFRRRGKAERKPKAPRKGLVVDAPPVCRKCLGLHHLGSKCPRRNRQGR